MKFWKWLKGGGDQARKEILYPNLLHDVQVRLQYKHIKNIHLRVLGTQLCVSVPYGISFEEIYNILKKKEQWIYSKLISKKDYEIFCNQGEFFHLGEKIKIHFEQSKKSEIIKNGNVLSIYAKNEEKIAEVVEKWQKNEANKVFLNALSQWEQDLGVKITHLSIKKMKTRWGSCNAKKGYVNLNFFLIKMPKKIIEYVALHEMIHFFIHAHNKDFYAMMNQRLPDWKDREIELREWGRKLII